MNRWTYISKIRKYIQDQSLYIWIVKHIYQSWEHNISCYSQYKWTVEFCNKCGTIHFWPFSFYLSAKVKNRKNIQLIQLNPKTLAPSKLSRLQHLHSLEPHLILPDLPLCIRDQTCKTKTSFSKSWLELNY